MIAELFSLLIKFAFEIPILSEVDDNTAFGFKKI